MQFFLVAFLAVLSNGVSAAPTHLLLSRAGTCNVNRFTSSTLACVAALAPSFPTACNPAVAQQGANTPLNTACLAAAAKGTAPFPTACTPCASQFGVTDPANKAATTKNSKGTPAAAIPASPKGATNAAGAAPVGPRASTCDIQSCVVALGPSFPACAPAIAQLGADTTFNAACLAAAAKGTAPFPSPCAGCAAQFGVTDPGSSVKDTSAGSATNDAPRA
ncbi:hypothetical protein C8R45DRAFT_1079163 [Mycena sanguinolenta]|nr:hypothetical protein C8R45DRAFT_1079163 [Mycena sanguinolenta]